MIKYNIIFKILVLLQILFDNTCLCVNYPLQNDITIGHELYKMGITFF